MVEQRKKGQGNTSLNSNCFKINELVKTKMGAHYHITLIRFICPAYLGCCF